MRRDLERRLAALESRRYGTPRTAAIMRLLKANSDEEWGGRRIDQESLIDPTTLSNAELNWFIKMSKMGEKERKSEIRGESLEPVVGDRLGLADLLR